MEDQNPDLILSDEKIEAIVREFVSLAMDDALLGPIFRRSIPDTEAHVRVFLSYWLTLLRGTREYRGRPLRAHLKMPIAEQHFARWLELFQLAVRRTSPGFETSELFSLSEMIADGLNWRLGVARSHLPAANAPN